MEEEEPDYLSDEFLAQCIPKDVRPGLLFKHGEKRKHEILKKNERKKSRKEIEDEQREEGLKKEISSDNKGFVLLQKMGFKPGMSIGKSQEGRKDPVAIEMRVKSNRIGLGHKSKLEDRLKEKTERSDPTAFRARFQLNTIAKEIDRDLKKAKSTCRDLDSRSDKVPPHPWYWPKIEKEDEDEDEDEEEIKDDVSQLELPEQLKLISTYLREIYFYCLWCGVKYENQEDLQSSCPGTEKDDH